MSTSAQRKVKPDPVGEAAKQALVDAEGDAKSAVDLLEAAVRKDFELRMVLTDPLIRGACSDAVRAQIRTERKSSWTSQPKALPSPAKTPAGEPAAQVARVTKLAEGNLLMFPLPGGKRLQDASRKEITEAADFYEKQSDDMGTKARWLRLVAQSLPGRKTVGEVLTDDRLRELQAEAKKG